MRARKPTKADIARLRKMAKDLTDRENLLLEKYGLPEKRSMRWTYIHDLDALNKVAAYLEAQP